jgi:hypothetical protein
VEDLGDGGVGEIRLGVFAEGVDRDEKEDGAPAFAPAVQQLPDGVGQRALDRLRVVAVGRLAEELAQVRVVDLPRQQLADGLVDRRPPLGEYVLHTGVLGVRAEKTTHSVRWDSQEAPRRAGRPAAAAGSGSDPDGAPGRRRERVEKF